MVNIAKRMRGLKPLLAIRNGPGAAILPPSPAPQLIHVHLRSPPVTHTSPLYGARVFWRNHLRRIKFHNPRLPITVDYSKTDTNSSMIMTLQFEHADPEVLERIGGNVASRSKKATQKLLIEEMSEEEKEALARQQSPNFREAPVSWKNHEEPLETKDTADQTAPEAEAVAETPKESPADTDTSTLPSDAVVPAPVPVNVKGAAPPTLYRRAITLGLRERSAVDIWQWFSARTRCIDVRKSEEDTKEEEELNIFFKQSAIDRKRVKEGRDAVKKEKADLLRARGEAEKLKEAL